MDRMGPTNWGRDWRIEHGWDVVDLNGDKVGSVDEVGTNFIHLSGGFLGMKDLYIPFSAVSTVEHGRVLLNVPKDRISDLGWDKRPEESYVGSSFSRYDIRKGFDVYGFDDDKIGSVDEVHPDYLKVSRGLFSMSDLYIPFSAIGSVREDRVYLNVPKDNIDTLGWDTLPPTGEQPYGPGPTTY